VKYKESKNIQNKMAAEAAQIEPDISDEQQMKAKDVFGNEMGIDSIFFSEITMSIMVTVFVAVVTILVVLFFGIWKFKSKMLPSQTEQEGPRRYRFRKRDKVMFFGRKMLRKVTSFTANRRRPNHRLVVAKLRRFLAMRKETPRP